jgi:hypothetical protein
MEGRSRKGDLAVFGGLLLVRAVYYLGGTRFDTAFLHDGWQLPDYSLLTHHLLSTTWYFHAQPPLYVLLVGFVLKLSPFPDGITFQVLWLGLAALLGFGTRRLLLVLHVPERVAVVATLVILCAPQVVWMESRPLYDLPVTVAVTWLLVWGARYAASGGLRPLAWCVALCTALVLTRSLFHPVWMVGVLVLLLVGRRPATDVSRKAVAVLLGVPFLVVAGLMVKNQVLFGEPQLSSWTGPSLTKVVQARTTPETRRADVAAHRASPLFALPPYQPLASYASSMPACHRRHPGVPVLDSPQKQTAPGVVNFNDECFLAVFAAEQHDALRSIRHDPGHYAVNVGLAMRLFYIDVPVQVRRARVERVVQRVYDVLELGIPLQSPLYGDSESGTFSSRFLLLLALALAGAVVRGLVELRRWARRRTSPAGMVWLVGASTCTWLLVIGAMLEIPENLRFRSYADPFLLCALVAAGTWSVRAIRRRVSVGRARRDPVS